MKLIVAGRETTLRRIRHRAGIEMRRAVGKIRHAGRRPEDPAILLILGCQRSGTTMLSEMLARDARSDVFPEKSGLSDPADPHGLRLRPLADVRDRLARNGADLRVLKPLVESQRALEMLEALPRCRAVWMFRDWRDVVRSNLRMFGTDNGRKDLAAVLDDPANWRGEGVEAETRRRLRDAAPEPSEAEAGALFWYARNAEYFRQGLDGDGRVRIVPYEDYVSDPAAETAAIYRLLGMAPPDRMDRYRIFSGSVGAGRDLAVRPAVADLCDAMLDRLRRARRDQEAGPGRPG